MYFLNIEPPADPGLDAQLIDCDAEMSAPEESEAETSAPEESDAETSAPADHTHIVESSLAGDESLEFDSEMSAPTDHIHIIESSHAGDDRTVLAQTGEIK